MEVNIGILKGKVIDRIVCEHSEDSLYFWCADAIYNMSHQQDCCEHVRLEDIEGDLGDLVGSPILMSEKETNSDDSFDKDSLDSSFTWTFYRFATVKGYVTLRWLGESNGYYSEEVNFVKVSNESRSNILLKCVLGSKEQLQDKEFQLLKDLLISDNEDNTNIAYTMINKLILK